MEVAWSVLLRSLKTKEQPFLISVTGSSGTTTSRNQWCGCEWGRCIGYKMFTSGSLRDGTCNGSGCVGTAKTV